MLTVHHLDQSRSQRVLWLCEELRRDYAVVAHRRDPRTMLAPASLRAVHPLGKAPVIEEDGRVLAETGAIVEVLARGTDLLPEDDGVTFWLHHAEGSAMPPLVFSLVLSEAPRRAPALMRPLARAVTGAIRTAWAAPELARLVAFWDSALAGNGWFAAGRFTAADVMMSFPVEMAALRLGLDDRPATRDWLRRIHARPAYLRALERGGPYAGAGVGSAG